MTVEADYKITYAAPGEDGQVWNIATPFAHERKDQAVLLLKGGTDGFDNTPDITTRATVDRYGETATGLKIPAFGGTLKTVVGREDFDLRAIDRNWRQSWPLTHASDPPTWSVWNPYLTGRFIVADTGAHNRWLPIYRTAMTSLPNNYRGIFSYPCEVTWKSLAGTWLGPIRRFETGGQVAIGGHLRAAARLRWDPTQDATITFPDRQTLTLTSAADASAGLCYINLDRGFAGQVTREDGTVDSTTWSTFKGRVLGVELKPGRTYDWKLTGGVTLEIVHRYLSPWE